MTRVLAEQKPGPGAHAAAHLRVLDGWRGLSILLVLAAHFLPLGPKSWGGNLTAGPMGMALFFTLSGFLITGFLLNKPSVGDFLVRRMARILPLAWVALVVALWQGHAPLDAYLPHFLFYANAPPYPLTDATSHFWSLCVEMQFYAGIAVLFAVLGERGLLLLPGLCAAFTALRIANGVEIAIWTPFRVDEILAGAILSLAYHGRFGKFPAMPLRRLSPRLHLPLFLLFVISCHPDSGAMNYLRPYFAAALVGTTLVAPQERLARMLCSRPLAYLATVSYALYVVHPLIGHTWLGSGDLLEKYAKRPILFAAVFAVAHLSTFYYESRWIRWSKAFTARPAPVVADGAAGK